MKTRILLFGTFDYLHPGHINLFKQARKLSPNPYLIVSLARSKNTLKVKGHAPENTEKQRLELVSSCKLVDETVLGAKTDYIKRIVELQPDIIALGYDQSAYTQNLNELLKAQGLNVKIKRLKPYKKEIYKTSLLKTSS